MPPFSRASWSQWRDPSNSQTILANAPTVAGTQDVADDVPPSNSFRAFKNLSTTIEISKQDSLGVGKQHLFSKPAALIR